MTGVGHFGGSIGIDVDSKARAGTSFSGVNIDTSIRINGRVIFGQNCFVRPSMRINTTVIRNGSCTLSGNLRVADSRAHSLLNGIKLTMKQRVILSGKDGLRPHLHTTIARRFVGGGQVDTGNDSFGGSLSDAGITLANKLGCTPTTNG